MAQSFKSLETALRELERLRKLDDFGYLDREIEERLKDIDRDIKRVDSHIKNLDKRIKDEWLNSPSRSLFPGSRINQLSKGIGFVEHANRISPITLAWSCGVCGEMKLHEKHKSELCHRCYHHFSIKPKPNAPRTVTDQGKKVREDWNWQPSEWEYIASALKLVVPFYIIVFWITALMA